MSEKKNITCRGSSTKAVTKNFVDLWRDEKSSISFITAEKNLAGIELIQDGGRAYFDHVEPANNGCLGKTLQSSYRAKVPHLPEERMFSAVVRGPMCGTKTFPQKSCPQELRGTSLGVPPSRPCSLDLALFGPTNPRGYRRLRESSRVKLPEEARNALFTVEKSGR